MNKRQTLTVPSPEALAIAEPSVVEERSQILEVCPFKVKTPLDLLVSQIRTVLSLKNIIEINFPK